MESKYKEALKEAVRNFFDLEELAEKTMKEAAENYVYEHDVRISSDIQEKLEMGMEEVFDEIIDEVIEGLLWD